MIAEPGDHSPGSMPSKYCALAALAYCCDMERLKSYRRTNAAVLAGFFMAVTVILVIALPEGKLGSGVVLGIIVAAPLLLYLIASGDVAEVSGPGGLVAKFKGPIYVLDPN